MTAVGPLHVTLKVAARCNLNCGYCYVYNKADQSWRDQPAVMSDAVVRATAERLRSHCERSEQPTLRLVFHGGEPMLVGVRRFDRWCRMLRDGLEDLVEVKFTVQTNGMLVDDDWTETFLRHRVVVGVSVDGPPEIHDAFRVDHSGRGSYAAVRSGIECLTAAGLPVSVLSVAQFGVDPVRTYRHLAGLGACQIEFLLPDHTHDSIPAVRARFGPTPGADFLIPIFDDWWSSGTMDLRLGPFVAISRAILGGPCEVDFIGNNPLGYLFVEPDGSIEGLDVLRVCGPGLAATGRNVLTDDFSDVAAASPMHRTFVFEGPPLPSGCRACPEQKTCAGGYIPHRYAAGRGFDNPSAWCPDLLKTFTHIRNRLGVGHQETTLRRQALTELAASTRGPAR
ncbi:radical SAM protein [Actinoplanes derwentensis]|uniref:Radical SAM core domain-containing protein n=1 Tax=Actinoplanes derwentensis TaxID=113562 RepID=A0A1H1RYY4_9ACTN|nr:radical SAM protein [Actinoplanes derwentensis]GID84558.1 hypothetical protein Ade03nite_34820 [Actinoplanes derwentensis]SDS40903.1 uncharacterized protein SAMN04489716_0721 [Actinoplanes derwentensis]